MHTALGDDLWWILASGRHIVLTGTIPDTEIFSFSAPGHPWFQQEWLSHVLFYEIHHLFGPDALAGAKIVVATGIVVLLGWVATKRSGSPFFGTVAAVFAAWACEDDLDLRAKMFTVLGSIVLLGLVDAYRRGASKRILLWTPLVLLAWVNLHYGFTYGLVILGSYFGMETIKSWTGLPDAPMPLRRSVLLGAALLAAVVACLLNPQPLGGFEIAFEHLHPDNPWRRGLIEWKPPWLFRDGAPTVFAISLAVQGGAALLALALAWRRFDVADHVLVLATGILAYQSRRFAPLFAFVGAPLLARNLTLVAEAITARSEGLRERTTPWRAATAGAIALAGAVFTFGAVVSQARTAFAPGLFAGMTHLDSFPSGALEFLRANPLPGRMYNFFSWGGFLLWEAPGRPIYVDGRAAVAYPGSVMDEYQSIESARPGWMKTLDRYDVHLVLHHTGYELPLRLRQRGAWVRVYDDGMAVLFVRRSPETAEWLARFVAGELVYPDTTGAQLFLAERALSSLPPDEAADRMADLIQSLPDGVRTAARKAQVEGAAGMSTDPKALGTLELYEAAFERLAERGRLPPLP